MRMATVRACAAPPGSGRAEIARRSTARSRANREIRGRLSGVAAAGGITGMSGGIEAAPDVGEVGQVMMSAADRAVLRAAILRLRRSRGVVVRAADLLASLLGPMATVGLRRLNVPDALLSKVRGLSEAALRRAFDVAILGVGADTGGRRRFRLTDRLGQAVAAVSGAVSGLAGVAGFLPDVTLTTLLIMRRIASIAVEA